MSLPGFSVRNSVLVNCMMLVILAGGGIFAITLTREFFPESRPDRVMVSMIYPGVQPTEIEKAVTIKVEEALRDVDGVEKVESTVSEGVSTTIVTLFNDIDDVDVVVQDLKAEIDAIPDLPRDVESTNIRKLKPRLPVIGVAVYGQGDEAALKRAARDLRDDLLRIPGITDVDLVGVRDDEISVEVRPDRLYEFDVTFEEVAAAVRQTNIDVSGGTLKGERSTITLRTLGEQLRGVDLEEIVVRTNADGRQIRVRDVARVADGFVDVDVENWFNGQRSVNCMVFKTGDQDILQISESVKAYVAGKRNEPFDPVGWNAAWESPWYWRPFALVGTGAVRAVNLMVGKPDPVKIYEDSRQAPFAHEFRLGVHTDLARFLSGRIDLMVRNGTSGLILVAVSLLLFLNWRVAMWTALGIPVSFLGTFALMWMMGVSINLISLFGLIIVLGIIVDDAIVIGENIYRHVQEGMPPRQAAIHGAEEVMWPVIVAVTTTIGAFFPLMFLGGQMGEFFSQLPLVIMAALSVSLLEALVILPAHLMHLPAKAPPGVETSRLHETSRQRFFRRLAAIGEQFSHGRIVRAYDAFLRLALRWRYVTVAVALSTLVASVGLVVGGVVEWQFFPRMDSETLIAVLEMPIGTPAEATRERLRELDEKVRHVPEVMNCQTTVAAVMSVGAAGATGASVSSHMGQLIIELRSAEEREHRKERSSDEILKELREFSATLPGTNSVVWEGLSGGPGGKDIEIRVAGPDFDLILGAGEELKQTLSTFAGVVDLDDDFDRGQRELQLALRESARPTGINTSQLGEHVRSAMYGREARRLTRNREDVKIMVRYPKDFRENMYNIESMWIPTGFGQGTRGWVPLREVAEVTEAEGFSTLHRSQQQRSVKVMADVAEGASSDAIVAQIRKAFAEKIQPKFPGTSIEFLGNVEEQAKSLGSLFIALPIALMIIYMMIAGLFRSYYQPVVVMLAIPFALQGAIIGHWVTGYAATLISAIGFVALTGIVVNDAIVLVDYVNGRIRRGATPFQANLEGSRTRLRAIFLTSETTIAGLLPMLFETSFQAKFLIPMAVTISFGLLFSTILTLLIVPSINMIFFDVLGLMGVAPLPDEDLIPDAIPAEA